MRRLLLLAPAIVALSVTGCGCGPLSWFHRGSQCEPCGHFDACADGAAYHGGVIGGGIYPEAGQILPGPAEGEVVVPGRRANG